MSAVRFCERRENERTNERKFLCHSFCSNNLCEQRGVLYLRYVIVDDDEEEEELYNVISGCSPIFQHLRSVNRGLATHTLSSAPIRNESGVLLLRECGLGGNAGRALESRQFRTMRKKQFNCRTFRRSIQSEIPTYICMYEYVNV